MGTCDICKKTKKEVNSIILHKKYINYCNNPECKEKAKAIKEAFKMDVHEEYLIYEWNLGRIEKEIMNLL